jgi:hypothetical protein
VRLQNLPKLESLVRKYSIWQPWAEITDFAFTHLDGVELRKHVNMDDKSIGNQGDQIGRIFAHWADVYSGHFVKGAEIAPICGRVFSMPQVMCQV